MAKKKSMPPRAPKKSLMSKKASIDKLIEASKNPFVEPESPPRKASVRLPPPRSALPSYTTSFLAQVQSQKNMHRRPKPKQVTSGLPGLKAEQYLLLDRRHEDSPAIPLVRLPHEPSTSRSLRYIHNGQFPFLELPGELRNKIYDSAITKENYAIEWINYHHTAKSLTYRLPKKGKECGPKLEPDAAQRRRLLDLHRRPIPCTHLPDDSLLPGPATLLLICKQISEESASVFYSKSTFGFHGLGALRHFLNNLRPIAKTSITRLSLNYRAYGNPSRTENLWIKARHDRTWEKLCWRITDECISLTHLNLDLRLNKSPISFAPFDKVNATDLGTQWIKPLWAFQDAGIKRLWGRIRCTTKESSVLEVESWKTRKEILGDLWDEEAESNRDAYGNEKRWRDRKDTKGLVLRLRVDGGLELA